MKVAVIGAGVVGVTTAYELIQDGHQVTVLERHSTAAEAASFANGSLIAPVWLAALAQPGRLLQLLSPAANHPGGLRLEGLPDLALWRWIWRWQRASRAPDRARQQAALFALAQFSQERLVAITESEQLDFDRSDGLLVLFRSDREAAQARTAVPVLREQGAAIRELDAAQARQIEPSLNPETALHGALELSTGVSANCRQFTLQLKALAQAQGCQFEFETRVESLESDSRGVRLRSDSANQPPASFDAVVLCAGSDSAALLEPLGMHLPMQAAYGHSLSAAVREPLDAPVSAVIDARHQVSISRLGQRMRVAG